MIKRYFFIGVILLISFYGFSQVPMGGWRDHFDFSQILEVGKLEDGTIVGAAPNGLLYVYPDGSMQKLTKVSGLSDVGITAMAYDETSEKIIIGYENGNIDIIGKNTIENISDIKQKYISTDKRINNITIFNGLAYLSCGFGIVSIDMENAEVAETYYIGNNASYVNVLNTVFFNDSVFALTDRGIKKISQEEDAHDFSLWRDEYVDDIKDYADIAVFDDDLYLVGKNSSTGIFLRKTSGQWESIMEFTSENMKIKSFKNCYLLTDDKIYNFGNNAVEQGKIIEYKTGDKISPNSVYENSSILFIADNNLGVVFHNESNDDFFIYEGVSGNVGFRANVKNDEVIVVSGGYKVTAANYWNAASFSVFKKGEWKNYKIDNAYDLASVEISNTDINHYFVGSWGYGLFEYEDGVLKKHYDETNSPLEKLTDDYASVRISGMCFDDDGNLWVLNPSNNTSLHLLKNDGTWKDFYMDGMLKGLNTGDVIITKSGLILGNARKYGFFALNYNGTIDNEDDDVFLRRIPKDENGFVGKDVKCFAEDADGYIWFGTDQGVAVIYDPDDFYDNWFAATRIKITTEVEDSVIVNYLLGEEAVQAIAVDGANRKWFGTSFSGVYLTNATGTEQILHFDTENSPLPSNNIMDIKIDSKTGEVFFITDKGVVSYQSDANEAGNTFENVYVYPNPVRHDYHGIITIKGLAANVNVKITDIAGNIVYETRANGGIATWNGNNFDGRRVATGVYLIFCSNEDGTETFVTKMLFIN